MKEKPYTKTVLDQLAAEHDALMPRKGEAARAIDEAAYEALDGKLEEMISYFSLSSIDAVEKMLVSRLGAAVAPQKDARFEPFRTAAQQRDIKVLYEAELLPQDAVHRFVKDMVRARLKAVWGEHPILHTVQVSMADEWRDESREELKEAITWAVRPQRAEYLCSEVLQGLEGVIQENFRRDYGFLTDIPLGRAHGGA